MLMHATRFLLMSIIDYMHQTRRFPMGGRFKSYSSLVEDYLR